MLASQNASEPKPFDPNASALEIVSRMNQQEESTGRITNE